MSSPTAPPSGEHGTEAAHNDMRDLSERIDRALLRIVELRSTVEYGTDTYKRLAAKLDGVALVGSYVDEYLRTPPAGEDR